MIQKHDSKIFAHKKRDFAYDFSFRAFSRFLSFIILGKISLEEIRLN